jgi:ubiquinone biosynthesis protein
MVHAALAVGCAVLVAMLLVVAVEVVIPAGTLSRPLGLRANWRERVRRARRYGEILRIAGRHGLTRFLPRRPSDGSGGVSSRRDLAVSLRLALDDAGGAFIKLGPWLSMRDDLLPADVVDELAVLQDSAAPIPWRDVSQTIAVELGRSDAEVFAWVERRPLAAASVAQVHVAQLLNGTDVVVKVQRPDVARVVARDLGS